MGADALVSLHIYRLQTPRTVLASVADATGANADAGESEEALLKRIRNYKVRCAVSKLYISHPALLKTSSS